MNSHYLAAFSPIVFAGILLSSGCSSLPPPRATNSDPSLQLDIVVQDPAISLEPSLQTLEPNLVAVMSASRPDQRKYFNLEPPEEVGFLYGACLPMQAEFRIIGVISSMRVDDRYIPIEDIIRLRRSVPRPDRYFNFNLRKESVSSTAGKY